MSSPTVRRMCPCPLRPLRPILNVWRLWRGGGYLWRDELGMHALRGDSTKGGSPRSGHESHVICMGWTRIIVCHGAYVISSVQTHLFCSLTCFLHGVVMHGCLASTRCGHGCVTWTRCGRPTRCMMLTRLTASMLLMSTYFPTTPYSRHTCVAYIACMV